MVFTASLSEVDWCKTMANLQDFLEYLDQADLLHRGLQGLSWKLDAGALRKIYNPCDARSFSDGFGALFAGLDALSQILENDFL